MFPFAVLMQCIIKFEFLLYIYTVRCKKTAPFYFCNNFAKSFFTEIITIFTHIYSKFGTKQHQNHQSNLKYVFTVPCEMEHTCICSQYQCNISLNIILAISNIINEISHKVWKSMD